jgi:alkanesulfonate monooxygenase SsuD/methylene tetrahydromethanopterin reductase-like flavin-dependent oxidoreductase (luciferase family)
MDRSRGLRQQDETVTVEFDEGSAGRYDLVLGADGVHSQVRRLVVGADVVRPVGQVAWRFVTKCPPEVTTWTVLLGRDVTFLAVPIGRGQVYCYCDAPADSPSRPEGDDLPGGLPSSWPSTSPDVAMNRSPPIRRGLGVTAGLDAGLARALAVQCERLGYHSLWSNDEPASPGLETLAHFAAAAPQLELGVGVLPLDRHQPVRIAAEIARLRLDPAKLWIGVGSGQLGAPIQIMLRAVAELRELLPDRTRIVVAAMRPRMCRLGGTIADAVLLNWMLPAQLAGARRWVQEGADKAGRAAPVVASYVRVAVGHAGSLQRLRDEESRYRNINEAHRQHFEAMNVPLGSVGVSASTRSDLRKGLAPYHSTLDLPIARLLAAHDAASLSAAAAAAAP